MRDRLLRLLGASSLLIGMAVSTAVGARGEEATVHEIATRMQAANAERSALLEHYSAERTYRVEYRGVGGARSAAMRVHAEYRAPGEKTLTILEEDGSKLLRDRVLHKLLESEEEASRGRAREESALSLENYQMELLGEEESGGERAWVLRVTPRAATKYRYRGRVWVSQRDYGVMRVEGEPAKNPSWWITRSTIDSRYERRGRFWVPSKNISVSHMRLGGDATLTIDYAGYVIRAARESGRLPTQAERRNRAAP